MRELLGPWEAPTRPVCVRRGFTRCGFVHVSGHATPKCLVPGPWSWGRSVQHRPGLHGLAWAPVQAP